MSKFLKFIVNIFLICAILIAAAILIPPLVGIQTTIVDTASMDTNLPLGSITYSTDVDASEIKVGDEVLKDNNTSTYAYIVKKIDKSSDTFTVVNAEDKNADTEEITLRNSVPKVAVVVPYIGYVIIAMHSTEGIIVIALVVVLIVILFILSELWKEKPEEEAEDEEDSEKKTYSFIEEDDETEQGGAGELVTGDTPETGEQESAESAEAEPAEPDTEETPEGADGEANVSKTEETEAAGESEVSDAQETQNTETDEEAADAGAGTTQKFDFHLNPEQSETDTQEEEEIKPADIAEDDISDVKIPELKRQVETPEDISRILSEPDEDTEEKQNAETSETPDVPQNDSEQKADDEYDLSEAIEQATREAEEQAAQDAAEKAQEKANAVKSEPEEAEETKTDNNIEETQTEDQGGENEDEAPEQFVPVEHATLDELMDQARKAGDEPDVSKDEATGITVVDYSGVL